ncbi:hypothetical protein SAMN05444162_1002 [Paenibacillaceae bacterium GAS479]|nr:hypothetical protein SAMN05444162_1002 [Paenibacillaceae bacterium GAS479]
MELPVARIWTQFPVPSVMIGNFSLQHPIRQG